MKYLWNERDLRLLRCIVSGETVGVNINALSKRLSIHRATARSRVSDLFSKGVLGHPHYSFLRLLHEYPLLVLSWADIPRTPRAAEFFKDDSHVFAAFSCMEGPYNTFLVEFFPDMETYHFWRETIVKERKLPSREGRSPAEVQIFSNRLSFKNDPCCFLRPMKRELEEKGEVILGDVVLDELSFNIMSLLLEGECIWTNESAVAERVGVHRKTIGRRLQRLLDEGIVSPPRCHFSNLLVPPGYNLIVSMVEVKDKKEAVKKYISNNDNVSRALDASTGRYNMLVFSAFSRLEDFFLWGEDMLEEFSGSIGAIDNTFLSSRMIHTIKQQKISLGFLDRRLRSVVESNKKDNGA